MCAAQGASSRRPQNSPCGQTNVDTACCCAKAQHSERGHKTEKDTRTQERTQATLASKSQDRKTHGGQPRMNLVRALGSSSGMIT
eukprot:9504175-Pyramimonas_sp.AAC.4